MASKRSTKRKYNQEDLDEALKKIRSKELTIRGASRNFGVPRGTLQDRLHGRVAEGRLKMGPSPVLSKEEEERLVEWVINLAKCGFPLKMDDLLNTVQKIIKNDKRITPFIDDRPGRKWYAGFLKRNNSLTHLQAEAITTGRAAITKEKIQKWFNELKQYLTSINCENVLLDPSRIFNGDETSFSLAPKTGRVLAPKGWKNTYQIKGNEKDTLTVLFVYSACGKTLPPMVIFPYVRPPERLVKNMPVDWILGRSNSGWMQSETFFEYVANSFNKFVSDNNIPRPVILYVDGHKSHMTMELSKFCEENNIILYALPPNTTHILQPADVGAFKSLKNDYRKIAHEWYKEKEEHITKENFSQVLQMVLKKDRSTIIQKAFKKCGLYPFDIEAPDYSKCVRNTLESITEVQNENQNLPLPPIVENCISRNQLETTLSCIKLLKNKFDDKNIDCKIICDIIEKEINLLNNEVTEIVQNASLNEELPSLIMGDDTFNVICDGVYYIDKNGDLLAEMENNFSDCDNTKGLENNNSLQISADIPPALGNISNYVTENLNFDVFDNSLIIDDIHNTELYTEINKENNLIDNANYQIYGTPRRNISQGEKTSFFANLNLSPSVSIRSSVEAIVSPSLSLKSKTNYEKAVVQNRIRVNTTASPCSSTSSFDKHLYYPKIIERKKKFKNLSQPSAISSKAWQEHYDLKKIKQEAIEDAKNERKRKRLEKLNNMPKRNIRKKNKVICKICNNDLDSDAEEDDLKNIGCDSCSEWYHLKCTNLNMCFAEAQNEAFLCNNCL